MKCVLVILGVGWIGFAQTKLPLEDALETTLRLHPLLRSAGQQVELRRGAQQQAAGIFDRTYQSALQQTYSPAPITTNGTGPTSASLNVTSFDFSAPRLYRNGVSAGPVVDLSRTRDNIVNPAGLSEGRVAYEVTVPLRRGRGTEVNTGNLNSAGIEVEATRYDLSQTASDLLSSTAASYWQLAGALRLLDVAASSEKRGQAFLENVQDLISADRIPRNEINQVRANLADRTAARIAAQQDVAAARQALALAMGLPAEQMIGLGTGLADDLPAGLVSGLPVDGAQTYLDLALIRRADYLAARKRVDSLRTLLPAARSQTLPEIDLTLSTGYSGIQAGAAPTSYLAALFRGVSGADAVAGIRYQFAPSNNAAQGRLAQAEAVVRQAEAHVTDVARSISASVTVSIDGLRNSASRLERTDESVALFQQALDAEREKYRLGIGSLVDILTTEDRLTLALEAQVRARLAYALALTQLRQATGTVVDPNPDAIQKPGRDVFLTPPQGRN